MEKRLTAQQLYNELYFEVCSRARAQGKPLPDEVEVFKILYQGARDAIMIGEAPPDFLEELKEVKPHIALEREAEHRMEQRDKALREGTVIDIEDLLK